MQLSTRYGLMGVGALALLTLTHQVRGTTGPLHPTAQYLVGVVPNFAAAIAIAFVLLSIWSDQNRGADFHSTKRPFFFGTLISGLGLLAWELFQQTSKRLVFDPHDLGATLVGIGAAYAMFYASAPGRRPKS
jgi:hypothetical protein